MHAITQKSFVGLEVLELTEAPRPQPLPTEVLIHAHAAALPLVGLTAWQALVDIANNQLRQRVLIHGADGGVGHIAVQVAKTLDAHGAP